MSTDEPFTLPRKKHNILWWIGGILVLLLMLFVVQLVGPSPPISVSPQTTHITEPLGPDGLPDYEQYVLDLSREGVTPDNNAFALIWPALFPADVEPQHYGLVTAELGLDGTPTAEGALVPVDGKEVWKWLASNVPNQRDFSDVDMYVQPVVDQANSRPWTSEQIPPLANWVQDNKEPLDLLVEASRRPKFYAPSPTLLDNRPNLLIEVLLPHVRHLRSAARALSTRAMWHLGEGRTKEAWQDLLAVHRLAVLLTQGCTLVEQLVAMTVSGIACDGTATLLHHEQLTVEQARQIERDLATLPQFSAMARSLDEMERASALNAFIRVGTGGGGEAFSALSGGPDNDFGNNVFNVVSVDWNLVLLETNGWYDRLATAAELPDRRSRTIAFAKIEADMQQLVADARSPSRWVSGLISRQQRSKLVSSIMLGLFLPAVTAATDAQDRANATLELTRLAAALTVYRAQHGAYPEKLAELVPGVLAKLPVDLYNAKPFAYKRDGDGYLLYSMGENGTDDGGSNDRMQILQGRPISTQDEAAAQSLQTKIINTDDMSIRVPHPAFELPKFTPPPP